MPWPSWPAPSARVSRRPRPPEPFNRPARPVAHPPRDTAPVGEWCAHRLEPPMKIVNLSQRTPAWLAWRAQGVTASEAAVILNRSPYQTPWRLWA